MTIMRSTCLVFVLFSFAPALVSGAACRGKKYEEKIKEVREAEGCADAAPTGCACVGNRQKNVFDCPGKEETAWDSEGKKCVYAFPDKDATWTARHEKPGFPYPETYGKECGPQPEPGSFACTKVAGKEADHTFKADNPAYNTKMDSDNWCVKDWCYVDPCGCDKTDVAYSSWFDPKRGGETTDGKGLYYSYSMCGAEDLFTEKDCRMWSEFGCGKEGDCVWDAEAQAVDAEGKPKEVEVGGGVRTNAGGITAVLLLLALLLNR